MQSDAPTLTPKLLRLPSVIAIVGLSKSQIYRMIQVGQFPKPVHIGPNSVAWSADRVYSWVAQKIAAPSEAAHTSEAVNLDSTLPAGAPSKAPARLGGPDWNKGGRL